MLAGPGMRPQETANLAWALAVTGDADSALLADLLRSAEAHRSELTAVESHQLYQVIDTLWSFPRGKRVSFLEAEDEDNAVRFGFCAVCTRHSFPGLQ